MTDLDGSTDLPDVVDEGTPPVWFLDAEGVISPFARPPDRAGAVTSHPGPVTSPLSVGFRPEVLTAIQRLHESGVVEVRWLNSRAPEERDPDPAAGVGTSKHADRSEQVEQVEQDDEPGWSATVSRRQGNAAQVDAWGWKASVVTAWLDAHPRGRAVWTDGDVSASHAVELMCRYARRLLAIAPTARRGLGDWQLRLVERWLAEAPGASSGGAERPATDIDLVGPVAAVRAELYALAHDLGRDTPAGVDEWLMAPTTYLNGKRPIDVLVRSPETVSAVARASWGIDW